MVLQLTEEQTDIKRMVAEFAKKELADRAFAPETEEEYRERLRKLARQGLLGLTAPVEYGGARLSYFDALLAVEEMAKLAIQLNACRAVLYQAAAEDDDKELDPLQVSMAKVFIAETCTRVCDTAIQLYGGYGYMEESPINWRYRRVRGTQIYGGTIQSHRKIVAALILGRPNARG